MSLDQFLGMSARRESLCDEVITDRTGFGCGTDHFESDRATWSRNRVSGSRCIRRRRSSAVPERVEGWGDREPLRNGSQVGCTGNLVGTNHSLAVPHNLEESRNLGELDLEPRTPSSRYPTERSPPQGSSSSESEWRSSRSRSLGLHPSTGRNSSRHYRVDCSSSSSRCEADCKRHSRSRSEPHSRHCGLSNQRDRTAMRCVAAVCTAPHKVRPRSLERQQSQPATRGC